MYWPGVGYTFFTFCAGVGGTPGCNDIVHGAMDYTSSMLMAGYSTRIFQQKMHDWTCYAVLTLLAQMVMIMIIIMVLASFMVNVVSR